MKKYNSITSTKKLIFVTNPLRLSPFQLKLGVEIVKDVAQVFFAGWIVAPIATGKINTLILLLGIVLSLYFWYISLKITRKLEL